MSTIENIQPLEQVFQEKCKDKSKFPRTTIDYFTQYCGLVNKLRADIYPKIDAGLAANSEESGYYTAHDSEHFDEVVRFAGVLLNIESNNWNLLTPYEMYILLVAIRIHDAGNIHGRENHEKNCFDILINLGSLVGDDLFEKKIIALIAEAHGGKTSTGSKDTIGELLEPIKPIGNIDIRSQLLAGILRFADEICESRSRASNYLISYGKLPHHSEVFHMYAASIGSALYRASDRRVTLNYYLTPEKIEKRWGCGNRKISENEIINSVHLIDEILERLEKMDRERRYCNRFIQDVCRVEGIRATIHVINERHDIIESIAIPELFDAGYPDDTGPKLKEKLKSYCGSQYGIKLAEKRTTNNA